MSRFSLALGLLVVAAPLARAQDKDWKWDPINQPKAKDVVGDKFFRESDMTESRKREAKVGDKNDKSEAAQHTVSRVTGETLKVENDKPTEQRFKVEKWTQSVGEKSDSSLEGKTIVVKGTGAEKKWDCDDKEKLSKGAKAWIERELARKPKPGAKEGEDDENEKLVYPEKPVSEGDEWTRDPEAIAKWLFGDSFPIAKEGSSFKGKLTKVHLEDGVHYGHIEFKLVLKVKPSAQFSEGGDIVVSIETDGSLEEFKRQSANEKATLEMNVENKKQTDKGEVDEKIGIKQVGAKKHGPLPEKK